MNDYIKAITNNSATSYRGLSCYCSLSSKDGTLMEMDRFRLDININLLSNGSL